MNEVAWLIVGALAGWLSADRDKRNDERNIVDIVIGMVGAMIGSGLIAPRFGVRAIDQDDFSLAAYLFAVAGAVLLVAIVRLIRRWRLRKRDEALVQR